MVSGGNSADLLDQNVAERDQHAVGLLILSVNYSGSASGPAGADQRAIKTQIWIKEEEKMINGKILVLALLFASTFTHAGIPSHPDDFKNLKEEQQVQLIKDIVKRKPFIKGSSDIRSKQFSIGKFFNKEIYRKLKGNDILGYEHDEGFSVISDNVFIRTVRTSEKTAAFRDKFIASLRDAAVKNKIRLSGSAETEIGVALLDVEPERTEYTMPGALVEVYFKNKRSGKYFFYRFGTGKDSGLDGVFYDIWTLIFSVLNSFR